MNVSIEFVTIFKEFTCWKFFSFVRRDSIVGKNTLRISNDKLGYFDLYLFRLIIDTFKESDCLFVYIRKVIEIYRADKLFFKIISFDLTYDLRNKTVSNYPEHIFCKEIWTFRFNGFVREESQSQYFRLLNKPLDYVAVSVDYFVWVVLRDSQNTYLPKNTNEETGKVFKLFNSPVSCSWFKNLRRID